MDPGAHLKRRGDLDGQQAERGIGPFGRLESKHHLGLIAKILGVEPADLLERGGPDLDVLELIELEVCRSGLHIIAKNDATLHHPSRNPALP